MNKSKSIKGIFKEIAKSNNLPTDDVVAEMQKAIDVAWNNSDAGARIHWSKLFPKGKPTVEQFICVVAKNSKNNSML